MGTLEWIQRAAINIKSYIRPGGYTDIYNRNGLNNLTIVWDFYFKLLEQLGYVQDSSIKVFCVPLQRRQTE